MSHGEVFPHGVTRPRARWRVLAALLAACGVATATQTRAESLGGDPPWPLAEAPPESARRTNLDRVEIRGHYDNAVGTSDAASQGLIEAELLKSRPALRPAEVLEFVPGMIVTQHSGDGKANQYFLRGFNLDHGTDFATTVNGVPVNLPSHAHGQGYSDLNFLIPELVEQIKYRKGPYFASVGDFGAAGSADIRYVERLDRPFAQLTWGNYGYRRGVFAGSTQSASGVTWLGAVEAVTSDGPWTVAEGLRRNNLVISARDGSQARGWSLNLMGYEAQWTATDQIPQRLIERGNGAGGVFGRFDSLDPSDGGSTSRYSLGGEWHRSTETESSQLSAYWMRYRLGLYSNFTYFLERPGSGDQFGQLDDRTVLGATARHAFQHRFLGLLARSEIGAQLRQDSIALALLDTQGRQVITTIRDDQISQSLLSLYGQTMLEMSESLRGVFGLRADRFDASVDSRTLAVNSGSAQANKLSPKFSLILGPFSKTEWFFNFGHGIHSNDARGSTIQVSPRTGTPVERVPGLVTARGSEIGVRSEAIEGLQTSLAIWRLTLDSELVYLGDAGETEPQAASRRSGIEWNNRWRPRSWLWVDADLAWTRARFASGDRIPNALDRVGSLALSAREIGPWSASLQWRYLGSGALVEDNTVRALPSVTVNARFSCRADEWLGAGASISLDAFNLANRRVNDIQYYYASRLPTEANPVADLHLHPAEPRSLRLTLRKRF